MCIESFFFFIIIKYYVKLHQFYLRISLKSLLIIFLYKLLNFPNLPEQNLNVMHGNNPKKNQRLYYQEKLSLREISKRLHLNRRTVKKYLTTIIPSKYQ